MHLPHPPQGLPAVDARHGQVHEDRVRAVAGGQQVQRIVATGGLAQFKAQGFKQLHQQLTVGLFVVHHQNAAALARVALARPPGLHGHGRCGLAQGLGMHLGQNSLTWNTEPTPGVLLTASSPPMSAVSILAMVAPTLRRGRGRTGRTAARKGLEDALDLAGREARPRVLHLNARHLARIAHAQRRCPAR